MGSNPSQGFTQSVLGVYICLPCLFVSFGGTDFRWWMRPNKNSNLVLNALCVAHCTHGVQVPAHLLLNGLLACHTLTGRKVGMVMSHQMTTEKFVCVLRNE